MLRSLAPAVGELTAVMGGEVRISCGQVGQQSRAQGRTACVGLQPEPAAALEHRSAPAP